MYKRKIPYVKFGEGKRSIVRFNPKLIDDWIESSQVSPRATEKNNNNSLSSVGIKATSRATIADFNLFADGLKGAS